MIYFISDLHLSPQTLGATELFETLLGNIAQPGNELFILGDFFEVWVGDDNTQDPFNQRVISALRQATSQGLAIRVMHGNRDFLLGEEFAAQAGITLLTDPYVLSTPEWQFVLSHGDTLCTDDTEYQAFRQQVRNPLWQTTFLAKPLSERLAVAQHMRQLSIEKQQHSDPANHGYTSDLNRGETDDFLRQYGYATMIHGHTHQPDTHDHIVDGIHVERWVLSDWHEHQGEALVWDGEVLQRLVLNQAQPS